MEVGVEVGWKWKGGGRREKRKVRGSDSSVALPVPFTRLRTQESNSNRVLNKQTYYSMASHTSTEAPSLPVRKSYDAFLYAAVTFSC